MITGRLIGTLFAGIVLAGSLAAQTVTSPINVSITNDGYNKVSTTVTGTRRSLDVSPVTGVTISSMPSVTLNTTDYIVASNSTYTALGSSATFTGAWVSTLGYSNASVMILADQVSAANGLKFQFSADAVNVGYVSNWTYDASHVASGLTHFQTVPSRGAYVRIVYTNGVAAQGSFSLTTVLKTSTMSAAIMDVDNVILDHHQALLSKSIIAGHTTAAGGAYVDVKVNPSGALTADVTQATSPWVTSGTTTANQGTSPWIIGGAAGDSTDGVAASAGGILRSISGLRGFNGTNWDRLRSSGTSTDSVAVKTLGVLDTNANSMVYVSSTDSWYRIAGNRGGSDSIGAGSFASPYNFLLGFNGTSWDRLRSVNTGQLVTTLKNSSGVEPSIEARKQTPTGNALNVQIGPGDPVSNTPVTIDHEHHQVHEGNSFRAEDLQTGLGAATVKYLITVPTFTNTIQGPHLVIFSDVYNGATLVQLYEGATATGGSAMTVYNRNRNSATTAGTTFKTGVTSTNGTLIKSFYAGAGKATSGQSRSVSEMVLKSNTLYRVDVIGQAAGTAAIISFEFYEDLGV